MRRASCRTACVVSLTGVIIETVPVRYVTANPHNSSVRRQVLRVNGPRGLDSHWPPGFSPVPLLCMGPRLQGRGQSCGCCPLCSACAQRLEVLMRHRCILPTYPPRQIVRIPWERARGLQSALGRTRLLGWSGGWWLGHRFLIGWAVTNECTHPGSDAGVSRVWI